MEKAILKTLIYANIFDYPLKAYEIHKWLIGRKASLPQIEKGLGKLRVKGKAEMVKDYYFLPGRVNLIAKRKRREKQSAKLLFKAKLCVWFLKTIPWVKLVGISGGLAMNNAGKKDDIDLFLITSKNRLWLTRLLVIGILDLLGVRRKAKMKSSQVAGKLCTNIILEEERLEQEKKDIFTAHEVLQMKVLWSRDGIYSKYLADNEWVFKFLPNWIAISSSPPRNEVRGKLRRESNSEHKAVNWILLESERPRSRRPAFAGMTLEKFAKWFQLKVMRKPQGMERIQDGALYFHPNDCRMQVLSLYKQKLAGLDKQC